MPQIQSDRKNFNLSEIQDKHVLSGSNYKSQLESELNPSFSKLVSHLRSSRTRFLPAGGKKGQIASETVHSSKVLKTLPLPNDLKYPDNVLD